MQKTENIKRTDLGSFEYSNSFVAFIDVLGFKSFVDNRRRVETYFTEVLQVLSLLSDYTGLTTGKKSFDYHVMSDSIVIAVKIPDKSDPNPHLHLRTLISCVCIIQYHLALHDIWIRGGISSGEITFSDENRIVTGRGLVNAVEMEKRAIYPRIVLDPKIVLELNTTKNELIKLVNQPESKMRGKWLYSNEFSEFIPGTADLNDLIFVNFLTNLNRPEENTASELDLLYNHIKKNIYTHVDHSHKYRWVKDYVASSLEISDIMKEKFLLL